MVNRVNATESSENSMSESAVRPAEGERRAISGYSGQYHVAAAVILSGLREQRLQWIRVADPEAGRVDDLQIGSDGRVDAYQIKWSQFPGLFTFNDLIANKYNAPNLLAQLAEGWSRLRTSYPKCRVLVHLLTNETPSNSSQAVIPTGVTAPTPCHFAAFLAQVWEPLGQCPPDKSFKVPVEWEPAWIALCRASGLSETDFEVFARDCVLEFTYQLPFSSDLTPTIEQRYALEDIEHISSVLFRTVADPARIIELNRNDLLHRLDWIQRFELVNSHHFPVNEALYQPINTSVQELKDSINTLPGGYIAVLGTPGSGKSTLLTKTLRELNERVFFYYAYVPDTPYPNSLRGESVSFLHDIGVQLEKAGFVVGNSPSRLDRQQLLSRLYGQLELLRRDWEEEGRKTIILIDGLDHIEREQNPQLSLLNDLPDPNQIPDGVYFVLGTQTVAPLTGKVRSTLGAQGRSISMQPLDRQQIYEMFHSIQFAVSITAEQQDLVYDVSNGHPLYFAYLLNRIRQAEDTEQLDNILHTVEVFAGNIDATYHSYWDQFAGDTELTNLLGLFARMRGVIDFSWIREWADNTAIERLGNRFAHYFRIEDQDRWYFFHNSFRLFVARKTSEFPAGTVDPSKDRDFHVFLADLCRDESARPIRAWEEMYHRASAKQYAEVLKIATQEYFRGQLFALRPSGAIKADILLALESAAHCLDPIALARLCLIGLEIHQRGFYLGQDDLVFLLLDLEDPRTVLNYLRTGNQLHVDASTALKASISLTSLGLEHESRQLFELAEPLDLLTGAAHQDQRAPDDRVSLLRDWAKAVVLFRSVNDSIETIRQIQYKDEFGESVSEDMSPILQSRLLFDSGLELLNQQRWTDLGVILGAFDLSRDSDLQGWFWLNFKVCRHRESAGDLPRAKKHLKAMLSTDLEVLGAKQIAALAEGTYRLLGDVERARLLVEGIGQPDLQKDLVSLEDDLDPFDQRFRINRLLYALGSRYSPADIVPDTGDPRNYNMVLFERDICTVAHIWAKAWLGQTMDGATTKLETLPLLRRYSNSSSEMGGGPDRFAVAARGDAFFSLLIEAVGQHGSNALDGLWSNFKQEWEDPRSSSRWSTEKRRKVILAFARSGFQRSWASKRLTELDEVTATYGDASERLQECINHAKAWIEVGEREQARCFLSQALERSYGIGYRKDYQLDKNIEWLDRINELEPGLASKRISEFAQAIQSLDYSIESRTIHSAAAMLLGTTYRWSPVSAIQLFSWLLDRGLITYETGLGTLLNAMLQGTNPPASAVAMVLSEELLPFSSNARPDLVSFTIQRIDESNGRTRALEEAFLLVSKIRLWAGPSQRPRWLQGLVAGLERLGLSTEDVGLEASELVEPVQDREFSSDSLKLNDGHDELSRQEVENRICSVADLRELVEKEDEGSYFNWEPVVADVIKQTTQQADLLMLAETFKSRQDSTNILACAAVRLNELGFSDQAWNLGEQALGDSKEYGWSQFFGNSRISALKSLSAIDKTRAAPVVFQYLIRDLDANFEIIQPICSSLEEILELIFSPAPVKDIWPEIEEHTSVLLRNELAGPTPIIFADTTVADTSSSSIVELAAAHLCHPCFAIAQAAQRSLGKLLLHGMPDVSNVLMDCLNRSEAHQESVLVLLDAVALEDPGAVSHLRDHIEGLIDSPNWSVRRMAWTIVGTCGWDVPTSNQGFKPLPPIYQIEILPQAIDVPLDQILAFNRTPVSDSSNPRITMLPFNSEIELLAEIADVPEDNLFARVVEIMRDLAPPEEWSAHAQRILDSSLRSAGLHLPRAVSRFRVARRAMFYAVAELQDAGNILQRTTRALERHLRTYDPRMVLKDPSHRPPDVAAISDLEFMDKVEKWTHAVEQALPHTNWTPDDDLVVLAENSTIAKRRPWESPRETRYSVLEPVVSSSFPTGRDTQELYRSVMNCTVKDYELLSQSSNWYPLAIQNVAHGYYSPGANWIAINPVIARKLGWSLATNGMFRWVNSDDVTMVESIWWVDGLLAHSTSGPSTEEVGEGWLVLASQSALEELRQETGPLTRHSIVVRQYYDHGEPVESSAASYDLI